jgi:hypothetical protein
MNLFQQRIRKQEAAREIWDAAEMDWLWQDIRFAVRSSRKNVNVTLAVIFSLGLGLDFLDLSA